MLSHIHMGLVTPREPRAVDRGIGHVDLHLDHLHIDHLHPDHLHIDLHPDHLDSGQRS